ncbi:Eukaryotic aspartyl protease [Aspergillus sp. HF37]|nr:Eukaryotic aspartyl protease [Aspergillus sp. HF37]
MRRYRFNPTKDGPYFLGSVVQQTGRVFTDQPISGRVRLQQVLQKRLADNKVERVKAEEIQDDMIILSASGSHAVFDPSKSSTFQPKPFSTWQITYADSSSASGTVGTDIVRIGGVAVQNQAVELANDLSTAFIQFAGDGLLGLAFSRINSVRPFPVETPVRNMIEQGDISAEV